MGGTPVPGSFQGLWSQVLSREVSGYPSAHLGGGGCSPVLTEGYPSPSQGVPSPSWRYPSPGQRVPQSQLGYPILGYPSRKDRTGLSPPLPQPAGTGLGHSPAPPPPRQNNRASTRYAADGMPRAVSRRRTLLLMVVFEKCDANARRNGTVQGNRGIWMIFSGLTQRIHQNMWHREHLEFANQRRTF